MKRLIIAFIIIVFTSVVFGVLMRILGLTDPSFFGMIFAAFLIGLIVILNHLYL